MPRMTFKLLEKNTPLVYQKNGHFSHLVFLLPGLELSKKNVFLAYIVVIKAVCAFGMSPHVSSKINSLFVRVYVCLWQVTRSNSSFP